MLLVNSQMNREADVCDFVNQKMALQVQLMKTLLSRSICGLNREQIGEHIDWLSVRLFDSILRYSQ